MEIIKFNLLLNVYTFMLCKGLSWQCQWLRKSGKVKLEGESNFFFKSFIQCSMLENGNKVAETSNLSKVGVAGNK